MSKPEKIDTPAELTGLALMRAPFPKHQISQLPKPTKQQTDEVRADFKKGIRCQICGQWHHPKVVHLDYVGHAALTDRLLDCDPEWNWEPVATDANGLPLVDANGGTWIRLTVCNVTRLGYGHAEGKRGGDAIKELIGDALRNAAMRFGAALDLWHKGTLHEEEDVDDGPKFNPRAAADVLITRIKQAKDLNALADYYKSQSDILRDIRDANGEIYSEVCAAKDARKAELTPPPSVKIDDEIPY